MFRVLINCIAYVLGMYARTNAISIFVPLLRPPLEQTHHPVPLYWKWRATYVFFQIVVVWPNEMISVFRKLILSIYYSMFELTFGLYAAWSIGE